MRHLIFASLIAALPMVAAAQAYRAENQLVVVPLNNAEFEVIEARGEGPRGMWCAAASFAQDRLRTPGASRLYVSRARGPSVSTAGRKAVVFTTNKSVLDVPATRSVSLSVRKKGLSLPVHHAQQFCIDYLLDIFDADR